MIRKVPFAKMVSINDVFQNLWQSVVSISIFDTIHIVYDSYTDDSIKECERMSRSAEVDPLEYVKLTGRSPVPVQIDRFWDCSKNKQNLQIFSRQFFMKKCKENNLN